jgi:hypothetical protein
VIQTSKTTYLSGQNSGDFSYFILSSYRIDKGAPIITDLIVDNPIFDYVTNYDLGTLEYSDDL